jgi:hypothetical protein
MAKQVSAQKVIAVLKKAGLGIVSARAMSHGSGYSVFKNPHSGEVEVYWTPATSSRLVGWDEHRRIQEGHHEKAVAVLTAAGVEAAIEDEIRPTDKRPTGLRQVYCRSVAA